MGIPNLWAYGEDIGSAIKKAEKILAKIKTNKFDKHDVIAFAKANTDIIVALIEKDDE